MNNKLEIVKLTGRCSMQDLGRASAQHLGFSCGGAADLNAFLSANQLLKNDKNDAALEVTLGKITLKAHAITTVAITGADCFATINDKAIVHWARHTLQVGDILQLKLPKRGLHTYIAITNGVNSPLWLNSRSQTLNEQALGFSGNVLQQGAMINLQATCSDSARVFSTIESTLQSTLESSVPPQKTLGMHQPLHQKTPTLFYPENTLVLRFIPNKTWHELSAERQKVFCENTFSVASESNRMGYRFTTINNIENKINNRAGISEKKEDSGKVNTSSLTGGLSKPITYGTIQLPMLDSPIVLMKERQTIGGYPVIGSVMQTDLFRLCQKRPGEKVIFVPTTLTFSRQQLSAFYQRFQ